MSKKKKEVVVHIGKRMWNTKTERETDVVSLDGVQPYPIKTDDGYSFTKYGMHYKDDKYPTLTEI